MSSFQSAIAQMQAHVIEKASADAAFKAELLADPRATIEKEFKVELPAEVKIEVQQAPANTVVLNLPYEIAGGEGGELSDDDLESVAGGSKAGAKKFFTAVGSGVAFGGLAVTGVVTHTTKALENTAVKVGTSCWG